MKKNELRGKAEAIMMGMPQRVSSKEECVFILDYITEVLTGKPIGMEVYEKSIHYAKDQTPKWIFTNVMGGMKMITLPFEEVLTKPNGDYIEDGVFCYVYNLDCPDFSELGYSYFENKGKMRRIG